MATLRFSGYGFRRVRIYAHLATSQITPQMELLRANPFFLTKPIGLFCAHCTLPRDAITGRGWMAMIGS
jgi:hypothetical protein